MATPLISPLKNNSSSQKKDFNLLSVAQIAASKRRTLIVQASPRLLAPAVGWKQRYRSFQRAIVLFTAVLVLKRTRWLRSFDYDLVTRFQRRGLSKDSPLFFFAVLVKIICKFFGFLYNDRAVLTVVEGKVVDGLSEHIKSGH